ncbi:MAG: hypothetical protein NC831_06975 [Candidatus Omnitrophica bacterium]|nr:hypothetical protein [Candidatus Omnitrophota bacterium]MCM8828702.1 hypothetical protein [Candidatus Omnitrophota bacterium]
MKNKNILICLFFLVAAFVFAEKTSFYLWLEPEWFDGVKGRFSYWPGPEYSKKATGFWAIAGPGISAEWSQGGESEWNSIAAGSDESSAECTRSIYLPAEGKYRIWVRYVDHRDAEEPFSIAIEKNKKIILQENLGTKPVVPKNDEYQLYWGFSFGWDFIECRLPEGEAILKLIINKPADAWRQIDAICITDDTQWKPVFREKPDFLYFSSFNIDAHISVRGSAKNLPIGSRWKRNPVGGKDFSMWTGISTNKNWWNAQDINTLNLYDVLFENGCNSDIKGEFQKQFSGRKDIPIISWTNLLPGIYLGESPDLSPDSPLRIWLEKTGTQFYILTNYANPKYDEKTGPATYEALTGRLAKQFLGYIHGETVGTVGVSGGEGKLANDRRTHLEKWGENLVKSQTEQWSKFYRTNVSFDHFRKSIPCLSCESIALVHKFFDLGLDIVGYELDATNYHAPMRIAFVRGAARQYGKSWINYASGNWGDACNYFTQEPIVPRGAKSWFHSKYAITDGVSISWYRRFYYLNYLSGASAIYWEQSLTNQWIKPGPGTHPVQLSPFGRATVDFQSFVDRLPDRGEPYTPVAFLLSYGHGYENVNYTCKMLNVFLQDKNDIELRELFNVAWFPAPVVEGMPQTPDVQSMPSGVFGNIFDVLVDRPARAQAIMSYPVVWAAGDVNLDGAWIPVIEDYLKMGGTLVLNIEAIRKNPAVERFAGLKSSDRTKIFDRWSFDEKNYYPAVPYSAYIISLITAQPIAYAEKDVPIITKNRYGDGSVIVTLVPHMTGMDERAHPALPFLMNAITRDLLPFELYKDGKKCRGEVMYQINKTKNGWIVALFNNQGIDKTQNGIARVDRRKYVELEIRTTMNVKSAKEYTSLRDLNIEKNSKLSLVKLTIEPGDVRVVYFETE